jgi:predicted O-linked N-acetylglucosamine transferase (SPINDLY family)
MEPTADARISAGREALFAGKPSLAVEEFQAISARAPADHEARYWLASARLASGDIAQGKTDLEDARILHALAFARTLGADIVRCQSDGDYAAEVAARLYANHFVAVSSAVWAMRLSCGTLTAHVLLSYGLALQHQGRSEEASLVFRAAAETFPSASLHQFLLYPQLLCENGDARFATEARAWASLYAPATPAPVQANTGRNASKLRIGYVAPTFANSQVRQFIAPLLESHDPSRVSVTLYPTHPEPEAVWPAHIAVHPIGDMSDAEAANLIRADGIDVLNDCWGHSAGSRLGIFAARVAPIQVAWINYIQTTGLEQMDYVLHADCDEPSGTDGLFTEQIWRIGPVFNAFRPAAGRLPPGPTPAGRTGRVMFGSFNHPAKLSDATIEAWSAILRRAPGARLTLKYRYFVDPVLQRATQARFAAFSVTPERLVFAGHSTGEEYFRSFADIDLFLDAWPAPGSTTTLEALSNGVPVLVLAGPTLTFGGGLYSRSIVQAAGLPELVATSPEDFVDRAIALTADIGRLDALRARVRPGFDGGAICDERGFTSRIETAFCEMYDIYQQDVQRGAA